MYLTSHLEQLQRMLWLISIHKQLGMYLFALHKPPCLQIIWGNEGRIPGLFRDIYVYFQIFIQKMCVMRECPR